MKDMLETHPRASSSSDQRAEAIEALLRCTAHCSICADACLAEDSVADLRQCIRTDLDCADICAVTARLLERQTGQNPAALRSLVEACQAQCDACAQECEGHADHHEHCRLCAEACRPARRRVPRSSVRSPESETRGAWFWPTRRSCYTGS